MEVFFGERFSFFDDSLFKISEFFFCCCNERFNLKFLGFFFDYFFLQSFYLADVLLSNFFSALVFAPKY